MNLVFQSLNIIHDDPWGNTLDIGSSVSYLVKKCIVSYTKLDSGYLWDYLCVYCVALLSGTYHLTAKLFYHDWIAVWILCEYVTDFHKIANAWRNKYVYESWLFQTS